MLGSRDVLGHLKRDELIGAVDRLGLVVADRRRRDLLIDELAAAPAAELVGYLSDFKRERLKELCRKLGLEDGGREKAPLVDRLMSGAMPVAAVAAPLPQATPPPPPPRVSAPHNHAMGTIFEELVRRFNEESNEEAGEHWTPRDAVKLMAKLVFLPIADQLGSGTYLLYDGAVQNNPGMGRRSAQRRA